jgi:hypothetical protein
MSVSVTFLAESRSTDLAHKAIKILPNARLLNCYSACETHEIACGDIRDVTTSPFNQMMRKSGTRVPNRG